MKKSWILILFAVVAAAQMAIPAMMIYEGERTLSRGELFKFRTAPVDPYDAFRGRYVSPAVEAENQSIPVNPDGDRDVLTVGGRVYVLLTRDEEGFASPESFSLTPPAEGSYIEARLRRVTSERAYVDLPLDRFYLPEEMAPQAETAYRQHSRRGRQDAFILVRIRAGHAVIEDLYVGGKPIREFINGEPR